MGGGSWSAKDYKAYTCSVGRGFDDSTGTVKGDFSAQDMFVSRKMHEDLIVNKIRECCDTDEHPNTVPVILALDVTGSMGKTSVLVAKQLNVIMTRLFNTVKDVEFMIMAIGDTAYDRAPIQASQFESDVRIAEHLDKIYFEGGGGGNDFESYTAAWYVGAYCTKLDCWNRGKKGLIITIGDEMFNPYIKIPYDVYKSDQFDGKIESSVIFNDVKDKYELHHLNISDTCSGSNVTRNMKTFASVIGENNVHDANLNNITDMICDIVQKFATGSCDINKTSNEISW